MANQVVLQFDCIIIALNVPITPFANIISINYDYNMITCNTTAIVTAS